MTNRELKSIIAKIDKRMEGVAKERDKLDDLISEIGDLRDGCENAYDYLRDARDSLSELV